MWKLQDNANHHKMFVLHEIEVVTKKKEGIAQCIVQHPGFDGVCLNTWVLL